MHTRDTSPRLSAPRLKRDDAAPKRPKQIIGLAAAFYREGDLGTEYEMVRFGDFRVIERLMPTAFDRAIRERDDVRALVNHDPSLILGRTAAGTLRLYTDGVGLRYEIDAPDTTVGRDALESLRRRDWDASSFAFDYQDKTIREVTEPDGSETVIIEVNSVVLYDVSVVSYPAYSSTTASARFCAPRAGIGATGRGRLMLARVMQMEAELRR